MQETPQANGMLDRLPKHLPKRLPKTPGQWLFVGLIGGALISGFAGLQIVSRFRTAPTQPVQPSLAVESVTALGRLEPHGEVIRVAATVPNSRIAQLMVQQGDWVKVGQVIAVLDSRNRLQAELEQAKQQVAVAQTKLAQVKAGAKQGEINAQKASIDRTAAQLREDVQAKTAAVSRLEAEVQNAQIEYQRYEALYQSGAASASQRDSKQLVLTSAQQQLNEAKANRDQAAATLSAQLQEATATLDQIAEVRPVDVAAAQAEVDSAVAAVKKAQAELDLAYIRAPRTGQILKVYTWAGETIGDEGVVELGQTQQIDVVAEVYETDVQRIRLGQTAKITSSAFPGTLTGTVKEIGLQVLKKGLRDTNPTADTDGRIVEVKIRLSPTDSQKVAHFTNLEVTVEMPLNQAGEP